MFFLQFKPILYYFIPSFQVVSIKAFLLTSNVSQKRDQKQSLLISDEEKRRGIRPNTWNANVQRKTPAPVLCPLTPPNLVGYIKPVLEVGSLTDVEKMFPHISEGGRFKPENCTSRHRVAILIPYRNRSEHLNILMYNLHRFLARQQIDYGVFVIEQIDNEEFNRAKLFNVGFAQSMALHDYDCFIFHDVDLLPVDDRNIYSCPEHPRHMSTNIAGYNGLQEAKLSIIKGPANVSRYVTLQHQKASSDVKRLELLAECSKRYEADGLTSLTYRNLSIIVKKLYTWIQVDLRNPDNIRRSSSVGQTRK